jgi:DNA polymerase I
MFLVLDCNYICWACAHALSTKGLSYKGGPTGVVYGFMEQLLSLSKRFEPEQIAFCWDMKPYHRETLYPEYKQKSEMTEEEKEERAIVANQMEDVRDAVLPALGFSNVYRVKGYEADDLIAAIVLIGHYPSDKTLVVSRDQDLYQLLDLCSMWSIKDQQTTSKEIFVRHYGIQPNQWPLIKAMAGCSSDNVKGIRGIGEKKAIAHTKGILNKGELFLRIQNSKETVENNLKLVKLPFEGTPTPRLRNNLLSVGNWKYVCEEFGFQSLLNHETIETWKWIAKRLNHEN